MNAPEGAPPDWLDIKCPRCGPYRTAWPLIVNQIRDKLVELECLSPWIRQHAVDVIAPLYLTLENARTLATSMPVYRPRDKGALHHFFFSQMATHFLHPCELAK